MVSRPSVSTIFIQYQVISSLHLWRSLQFGSIITMLVSKIIQNHTPFWKNPYIYILIKSSFNVSI